jgi:hypothetical protein
LKYEAEYSKSVHTNGIGTTSPLLDNDQESQKLRDMKKREREEIRKKHEEALRHEEEEIKRKSEERKLRLQSLQQTAK